MAILLAALSASGAAWRGDAEPLPGWMDGWRRDLPAVQIPGAADESPPAPHWDRDWGGDRQWGQPLPGDGEVRCMALSCDPERHRQPDIITIPDCTKGPC